MTLEAIGPSRRCLPVELSTLGIAAGAVLRLVIDSYRLLAELHDAIGQAAADPHPAQEHVTAATRELAAIQKLFERRGR